MQTVNERPVCHRSEDLVTYLYNEASAAEARDFASHLETCEACRAEFAVFNQVHESILLWRDEALGATFAPARIATATAINSARLVHHDRRLPALAALREFFSVSPLWLRGATALTALLLCVLAVLTIARLAQRQPGVVHNETQPSFSQKDIDQAKQKGIEEGMTRARNENSSPKDETTRAGSNNSEKRNQLTANRLQPKTPRPRGLTRAERVQLAADLRLTPGMDDEELPFVFPDEPNR